MFKDVLARVPPALLDSLTSPRGRASLRRLAAGLPPLSGAILEYHFGTEPRRLDLALRATRYDGGRAALAGHHGDWNFNRHQLTDPAWAAVFAFGDHWAAGDPEAFSTIENVWLEFDLAPSAQAVPLPCLFYDLDREGRPTPGQQVERIRALDRALGRAAPGAVYERIGRVLTRAPDGAGLHYVGLMLGRPGADKRICLKSIRPERLLPYLSEIGWAGASATVAHLLTQLLGDAGQVVLNLDVSERIGPRIGIEVACSDPDEWSNFLARLTDRGYATAAEAAAVLAWPGDLPFGEDAFQQALSRAAGKSVALLIKRLNHVKVVVGPDGGVEVKAYLYLAYF